MGDIDARLAEIERLHDAAPEEYGGLAPNQMIGRDELKSTSERIGRVPWLVGIAKAADGLVQSDRIILCPETDKLRKALYAD